jgi:uncharacterized SAM-binding protein YcdF (DUF218 family)
VWLLHLKTLLRNLVLPPTGPLLLALFGVGLAKRRPRLARTCLGAGIGSLWLLSTPVVSEALVRLAEHYPPLDLRLAADAQAIVILGGGGQRTFAAEYAGPAAEPLLLQRLSYGAYLARQTGLPILVTGFEIEAVTMRVTLLRDYGLEARWVDDRSYDTFQNARNSVRLLKADGIRRIVLVTSATHMRRAVHEFTAAGVEVVAAPEGILSQHGPDIQHYLPSANALFQSYLASYELIGDPVRAILADFNLRQQ